MKLFGNPMSTCTRKVLMTFAEKGQKPDFTVIDFGKGEHKGAPYVARQPFGQVPVIDDDGFVLYESRAIIRYLDERLQGPKLTPTDLKDRALMEQWISVEMSHFTPAAMKIIYQLFFAKMRGQEPDMAKVAQGKEEIRRSVEVLDETLKKGEYLAGKFSLAEISFMPYVEYLYACGVGDEVIGSAKNVEQWWKRISQRPTWKAVVSNG